MMNPTENQPTNQNTTSGKRYYWLKLGTNFFHSDDVKVILSQQNGEKYVLFWLKLLLKALEQEEIGVLKYKSDVPYTQEVLATVTDTDVDTVRSALNLFHKLGMVTIDPDGSIILDAVHGMIGSVSDSAIRMRRLRQRNKKQIEAPKADEKGVSQSDVELEIEKEIDIEKRESRKEANATPPKKSSTRHHHGEKVMLTAEEYQRLCQEHGDERINDLIERMNDYCVAHGKSYADYNRALRNWIRRDHDEEEKQYDGLIAEYGQDIQSQNICPVCSEPVGRSGNCSRCHTTKDEWDNPEALAERREEHAPEALREVEVSA